MEADALGDARVPRRVAEDVVAASILLEVRVPLERLDQTVEPLVVAGLLLGRGQVRGDEEERRLRRVRRAALVGEERSMDPDLCCVTFMRIM